MPATECSRISQEFLDEERRLHGPAVFRREYLCDFGATLGESAFDLDKLSPSCAPDAAAPSPAPEPVPPPPSDVATRYIETYVQQSSGSIGYPGAPKYVGFDLGQRSSHSALVALERLQIRTNQRDAVTFEPVVDTHLNLIRLERFPLNMTYDDIARRLKNSPALFNGGTPSYSNNIQRVPKRDLIQSAKWGIYVTQVAPSKPL